MKFAIICLAAASMAVSLCPAHASDELLVTFDQTQLLRIPRPAADIIISNPSIADVSVVSTNLVAITGKMYGTANLIVRGTDGSIITDVTVQVVRVARPIVVLNRGSNRNSFSCTPRCQPIFDVGDASEPSSKKGGPCDSPGQTDSAGRMCGGRSAYSRPGGREGFP